MRTIPCSHAKYVIKCFDADACNLTAVYLIKLLSLLRALSIVKNDLVSLEKTPPKTFQRIFQRTFIKILHNDDFKMTILVQTTEYQIESYFYSMCCLAQNATAIYSQSGQAKNFYYPILQHIAAKRLEMSFTDSATS